MLSLVFLVVLTIFFAFAIVSSKVTVDSLCANKVFLAVAIGK